MATAVSDVRHVGGEALITLTGAATSVAAIGIVFFGRTVLGFDISSLTLWLIIPAGAIATGMLAASGYYLGASWTGRRPSKQLLINMVLIGLTTFFSIQYLIYLTLRFEDGTLISDYVAFWEYYALAIEHQSMSIGYRGRVDAASTGELGTLGYAVEGLQFLGFLFGPVAVWFMLAAKPYCDSCGRYFHSRSVAYSSSSEDGVDKYLAERGVVLPHAGENVKAVVGGKPLNGIRLKLEECRSCKTKRLALFAVLGNDEVPAGRFNVTDLDAEW